MPEFSQVEVAERPYLYVDGTSSMDPAEISQAMGACFGTVMAFLGARGIGPAGPALAVYYTYAPDSLSFRAGFQVTEADLARAEGEVKADVTPAGPALHFLHTGPYRTLRDGYAEMMQHVQAEGLSMAVPAWEVYVDDPNVTPEDRLRTEVYVKLG